jgi:hypothetical protein
MPLTLPVVPPDERDVLRRIRAKFDAYNLKKNEIPPVSRQGELYEIAVSMGLRGRFTDGNQISRWGMPLTPGEQGIRIGAGGGAQEYDFVFPGVQAFPRFEAVMRVPGMILGEAKSYTGGLESYMRKALHFVLNDPALGGFVFVTPSNREQTYRQMARVVYETLSDPYAAASLPGAAGTTWLKAQRHPGTVTGESIRQHFARYSGDANVLQAARRSPTVITREIAVHAGFVIASFQIPRLTESDLEARLAGM